MRSNYTPAATSYNSHGFVLEWMMKLLTALRITGGASASAKDPLWKYLWLREEDPERFRALRCWLDVKDYLVMRCTGRLTLGYDSAHATFLFDTRPDHLNQTNNSYAIASVTTASAHTQSLTYRVMGTLR